MPNRGGGGGVWQKTRLFPDFHLCTLPLCILFNEVYIPRPVNPVFFSKFICQVEMVEETEYDDVVQCDHSYDRR